MPAPGAPYDEVLRPHYDRARETLPVGTLWFDAHTHMGHDDPDGMEGDPEDIVAGLDHAHQDRALIFPMQEPRGYPEANDRVLAAVRASEGRLEALARIDPNAPGAVTEARRCLAAGARGLKLHPRSDAFGLPHPMVERLVQVADEAHVPVLFHAGRGIPRLGEAVTDLARRHPRASFILAHCGISELGWIEPAAAELPNLFFDTAWWQVADMLALFAAVPPGRILYASDMPYGNGLFHGLAFLRCAAAVGLPPDTMAAIAGAQLERVLAGEQPLDLGPAPGTAALGPRDLGFERVVGHLSIACHEAFRQIDPTEPLSLALLACHRLDGHPVAEQAAELIDATMLAYSAAGEQVTQAIYGAMGAQILAGTPHLGADGAPL
jgi:hypothetical protein